MDSAYKPILDIASRKLIHSRNVKFDEGTPGGPFFTQATPPSSGPRDTYLGDDYAVKAPTVIRPNVYPVPQPIDPTLPVYGPHRPRLRPAGTTADVMAERRRRAHDARLAYVTFPTEIKNSDSIPQTLLQCKVPGISTPPTPRTYHEAVRSVECLQWTKAMEDELASLNTRGVWILVPKPLNSKVINTKWVFVRKLNPDGSLKRHKARLVAAAWDPTLKIDVITYSPVVRMSSVRIVLALTAARNHQLRFVDVVTAYLFSNITRCVYVNQPPGFIKKGDDGQNLVCLLNKSLYGIPESGRNWYYTVKQILEDCGLTQSQADPCVFYSITTETSLILCLFVDDQMLSVSDDFVFSQFMTKLKTRLEVNEVIAQNYLGLEIEQNQDGITLGNAKYIAKKLELYGFDNMYPVRTIS